MTFQTVRAQIESHVFNQFQNLNPPIEVVFQAVQETPPALPYVVCLVSYTTTTEARLCMDGTGIEDLRGNLQLSIYGPLGEGMGPLELLATEGMRAMNTMYNPVAAARVKCGPISGPTPVLGGDQPYALVTLSCAFSATV